MPDMLEVGLAWLDDQRSSHMAQTVEYHRGYETISISATLGSTQFEVADEFGVTVEAKEVDFLVTAADLILNGAVAEPEVADRIMWTRTSDGAKFTYEVLAIIGGGQSFRYADSHGTTLRIHTKLVDRVNLV